MLILWHRKSRKNINRPAVNRHARRTEIWLKKEKNMSVINVKVSVANGTNSNIVVETATENAETMTQEKACKSIEEIALLASKKAIRDFMRGQNKSLYYSVDLDDLRQEACLGALEGILRTAEIDFGIMDPKNHQDLIDCSEDMYHASAYYCARMKVKTAWENMRYHVKLSERTKRAFRHAAEFLEAHPDGKASEKELDELTQKMWLTTHKGALDVVADYIEYRRTSFVSLDDSRPGYENDTTWGETVTKEEVAENDEEKVKSGCQTVQEAIASCNGLSDAQKKLLTDSYGIGRKKPMCESQLLKKHKMDSKEYKRALKKAEKILKDYLLSSMAITSTSDLF